MTAATQILDTAPTEPGAYQGISDTVYHADRGSLSSTGARQLLHPSCPAIFRWEQDNPPTSTATFDFGHAAHMMVLGAGAPIIEVQAPDWRTKAAKEKREATHLAGMIPLLTHEVHQVHAMAAAIRQHPIASALLSTGGTPEESLYHRDPATGVMLRARPDWQIKIGNRYLIVDYKTSASAQPQAFGQKAFDYGYHSQDAWYVDAVTALGIDDNPAFVFIVQEKTAPYLVSVVELDPEAVALGRRQNRRAINTYAECLATDTWPAWDQTIYPISLPKWAYNQEESE
ncbi:hypothetical protein GCM10007304_18140 [Rhodococcoides trifolii]|uniref:Putative exodeoxyribonuclease 8 PDDEXK-like domain-containing protein n=1 Tax=Rhodococcoides trifolii TaxID=908250 RepID=A0A917D2J8_9NOCA|nr:PD-(D/E)XK nuclease-like domain-containing protein [Rhodococcus trifolii]GGG04411.1 hypothetical protein GCM10007304_18140 [Rhodococcus trifolii]